jgi:hypothetical protein
MADDSRQADEVKYVVRSVPSWARYLQQANESDYLWKILFCILIGCLIFGMVTTSYNNFERQQTPGAQPVKSSPDANCSPGPCAEKQLSGWGKAKAIILILWIILPPLWFFAEFYGPWAYELELKSKYVVPIDNTELQDPAYRTHKWERFKYRQDLTAKVWLAVVTALTIIYFGKDIR